jgi:hypothetical protein
MGSPRQPLALATTRYDFNGCRFLVSATTRYEYPMQASPLVGFQCQCGRRTVYERAAALALLGRPGDTIHDIRLRMRCRRCNQRGPNGPYPFDSSEESGEWCCTDKSVGLRFPIEAPPRTE